MSDLLPANATAQERALSEAIERAGAVPVVVREVWNPDTCPAPLLAWLAWAFSVDEWDAAWTDAQKRDTIRRSIVVHRYKGTIGAVREALAALQFSARVQEWFNQIPAAEPYTFRVLLEAGQVGISQSALQGLINLITQTKNLRSHLARVDLSVVTPAGPLVAVVGAVGSDLVVTNYVRPTTVINETTIVVI
jgi:phage tail P2-like protein